MSVIREDDSMFVAAEGEGVVAMVPRVFNAPHEPQSLHWPTLCVLGAQHSILNGFRMLDLIGVFQANPKRNP